MGNDNKTVQELIDSAEQLEDKGAISEALECWRAVLEYETDAILFCRFGRLAMKAGKLEEARQAFLSAVNLDPNLSHPYDCLGLWFRDQVKPEEAINYFNKSLGIKETAPTYTLLGAAQLQLGKVAAARESFSKAVKIDADYEEAYYNLGLTFAQEQCTEAIALFRKALELDPEYADAHRELGWVLRQLEQYPEAELHLRKSIELDDSDGWAYVYLGNLLWTKKEFTAAEEAFKKAIEVWPGDSLTHRCLAMFYQYQGRPQEADFFYEKALQLDPDDPETNLRFGLFLKELGENVRAKIHLELVLSSDPQNEHVLSVLAELD